MNFRSLLVFLDSDARCEARSHLAVRFAALHKSHLVGVAPTGLVEWSSRVGATSGAWMTPLPRGSKRWNARATVQSIFASASGWNVSRRSRPAYTKGEGSGRAAPRAWRRRGRHRPSRSRQPVAPRRQTLALLNPGLCPMVRLPLLALPCCSSLHSWRLDSAC